MAQQEAGQKYPSKSSSGVDSDEVAQVAVVSQECEGWGGFSTKGCRASSGHPAAPSRLVVAGIDRISN